MTSGVRFGVVGCGRMGARRAQTVADHPGATLVAVSDLDRDRTESVAATLGCDAVRDVEALVGRSDIDTVFVCTPNRLHMPHAVAAVDSGKHVFCEKPLGCTPHEAAAIVHAADKRGVTVKVGANLRFFANVQKAYQLLEGGCVGEPLSLRGWIGNEGWPAASWFGDPALSGGGTVLDNGCHLLDVVRVFLGDAVQCTGMTGTLYWDTAVEDNGVGVFRTARGQLAVVQSSWTEWTTYFAFDVHGTDGVITVDNRLPSERTSLVRRDGATETFDFAGARNDTYGMELDAYLAARASGRQPEPGGVDGLRVVEMADALYRSAHLGRSVAVTSASPGL